MKKTTAKLLVLAASVLIFCSSVFASDVQLDKIVVTASRTEEDISGVTKNVDVVTKKDIETSQANDLAEVLTGLTSVNISDHGGPGASKTIRMRGSTASQVLVMIDGRPINSPRDGEADLSAIPLDNIDRVEVVHGPGSSLYGAGAMGGTVNIITKNPPKENQKTELYSSFGTFRTYNERISNGARLGAFGYLVSGEYQNSAGFRRNSESDAKDINTKLEYEPNGNNTLLFNSGFFRSTVGAPGLLSSPDIDDKQKIIRNYQDFSWNFKPDDTTGLLMKVYQNYDRLEFNSNSADTPFETANAKFIHTTTVRGYDLQLTKQLLNNYQVIGGFNYVGNFNDSTSSEKHSYIVRAVYLENRLDVTDRLKFNFGARLDDYSNFGTQIDPSFSFLYSLLDNLKLHGAVSRSFRAPTFNDLFWPDEGWDKGNPNLKPEKGVTKEIGLNTEINKYLNPGLTYYRSDFTNLINWMEESGVWQPENINSAVIDGVELENKIKFTDNWSFDTGYTFLSARDKDTHKYLIYQPRNKVDLALKYKDLKGFICELKWQFTDKRFHDPENTIEVKRFYVLGLNASKKFKSGVTCFASIENLLARKYQVIQDFPMPGFSFTGGLKVEF
ncbi:MAG: TonB-dependent receptor [Candidatus Omnitrophica bacterium]|nr:TonB-dependent receptor [Candidatus Omnitrophota bacterium]